MKAPPKDRRGVPGLPRGVGLGPALPSARRPSAHPAREDKTGQWAQGLLPLTKASSPLDAPQGELPLSAIHINLNETEKQIRSFLIEGGQRPGLGERV